MAVELKKIAVIGPGMMGTGIAELCAISGYETVLIGRREMTLNRARQNAAVDLDGFFAEGFISEETKRQAESNLHFSLSTKDCYDSDLVIESIYENLQAKQILFWELDQNCRKDTILATDTSTLPITEIASIVERPERVLGMHFFSSVPKNRLLEVIMGNKTDEAVLTSVRDFSEKTGKTMVVSKDTAGFIINRLQCRLWNESVGLVQEGSCPEDVDLAVLQTVRPNWGPLALIDFCGVDLMMTISDLLWRNLKTERYRPSPLMSKMIELGWLGQKSGKGFYEYTDKENE